MEAGVRPGVTTGELDEVAGAVFRRHGAVSAPRRNYGFPGETCISVDDEAVHGIPGPRVLRAGAARHARRDGRARRLRRGRRGHGARGDALAALRGPARAPRDRRSRTGSPRRARAGRCGRSAAPSRPRPSAAASPCSASSPGTAWAGRSTSRRPCRTGTTQGAASRSRRGSCSPIEPILADGDAARRLRPQTAGPCAPRAAVSRPISSTPILDHPRRRPDPHGRLMRKRSEALAAAAAGGLAWGHFEAGWVRLARLRRADPGAAARARRAADRAPLGLPPRRAVARRDRGAAGRRVGRRDRARPHRRQRRPRLAAARRAAPPRAAAPAAALLRGARQPRPRGQPRPVLGAHAARRPRARDAAEGRGGDGGAARQAGAARRRRPADLGAQQSHPEQLADPDADLRILHLPLPGRVQRGSRRRVRPRARRPPPRRPDLHPAARPQAAALAHQRSARRGRSTPARPR